MATNTCFNFAWLSRCQQLLSFGYDAGQVLRMNGTLPSMDTRLLRRTTCVIMPALVQELRRTIRSSAPNQSGKRVDDLPDVGFWSAFESLNSLTGRPDFLDVCLHSVRHSLRGQLIVRLEAAFRTTHH